MSSSSSHEALEALGQVQNELSVHSSASRAILTHLCQRLARLEAAVSSLQSEMARLRTDSQQDTQGVRSQVSGVQAKFESMSTQLNEYASVMDLFQNEMNDQKKTITWISSTLTDERGRVNDVKQKVENQRDDFNSRFSELSHKLEEIPRSVVALLSPTTRETSFTFQTADDKVSMESHMRRLDGYSRGGDGGPYTDLQPFTIPDDMKAKVEMRIREREQRKEEADALAAAELAEAYRRLQLASNPRLSEVRIQVDQCQEQIKRAFRMIRDSNLHLYSCCESKVEKMDFTTIQNELKALRGRLREIELSGPYRMRHPPAHSVGYLKQEQQSLTNGVDSLMISTAKDRALPASSSPNQVLQLTASQIPELRVSLLELSRNFNVLKLQWKKQHRQKGLNPVVKAHMEKVVAMINDAYSATAEEPIDLATVALHVEKVSRVLSSDFSIQILGIMGCRNPQEELLRRSIAANEIVPALCRYAELFTEYTRLDAQSNNNNDLQVAPALIESHLGVDGPMVSIEMIQSPHHQDQQHNLERINREMEELMRNQRRLETTLAQLASATGVAVVTAKDVSTPSTSNEIPASSVKALGAPNENDGTDMRHISEDLERLREEIAAMRRHFVSEDTLGEVLRQLEAWKSDREWNASSGGGGGGVIGHRYPSTLSKRHNASNLLDFGSSDPIDSLDRLKSQPKLDPLQIHKMSGELRPARVQQHSQATPMRSTNPATSLTNSSSSSSTLFNGRGSALSKLQARSQMMRPKTSAHPQHPEQHI